MLRGIEKSAALPLATSTLSTIIVSVRRLQRPGPASAPTSRRSSLPSTNGSGTGSGVGLGVGGTVGMLRGVASPVARWLGDPAGLVDGASVPAGSSPKPFSSPDDAKIASTVSWTARTSAPTTTWVAPVTASRIASTTTDSGERGTFAPTFHHASMMAVARHAKRTTSATDDPEEHAGLEHDPEGRGRVARAARTSPTTATTSTG